MEYRKLAPIYMHYARLSLFSSRENKCEDEHVDKLDREKKLLVVGNMLRVERIQDEQMHTISHCHPFAAYVENNDRKMRV